MPLDPAFGFAMVVFFFEDWLHHEYYSYAGNVHGGGRREGASVYPCIRAQGRQQKHSQRRKSTEDTVLKKKFHRVLSRIRVFVPNLTKTQPKFWYLATQTRVITYVQGLSTIMREEYGKIGVCTTYSTIQYPDPIIN